MQQFTDNAREAIQIGKGYVATRYGKYYGTEHLLLGLLTAEGVASHVLRENGVEIGTVCELLETLVVEKVRFKAYEGEEDGIRMSPGVKKVLDDAVVLASVQGLEKAGTEHLLMALLKEPDCVALRMLNTMQVSLQKLFQDAKKASGTEAGQAKAGKGAGGRGEILEAFCTNLTASAKAGNIDPVIGKNAETARVIQILCRRTKNNPCLVGEPGVGKTAAVEGLAQRIAAGLVPPELERKQIMALDLSAMVAGTKYRGEFEERIKGLMDEVMEDGNIILFIDEIHTVIGTGGAEGSMDAANILKPALSRGRLQVIGATTQEEYRKYIEKDTALARRFQAVTVEESSEEETYDILKGIIDRYEAHHRVTYTEEALWAAIRLSKQYIHERYLPDKAIDLVDEAGSFIRLGQNLYRDQLFEMTKKKNQLDKEKEQQFLSGNRKEMEAIVAKEKRLVREMKKIEAKLSAGDVPVVGTEEIAAVVSRWSGIPLNRLSQSEAERLMKLEETLHQRVIGQEEAIKAIARAIRRSRVGLKDPNRPIGSFLLLGPTGVGKTELCKAVAETLFGDENAMVRVDMSEYMEKHAVSRMIGSPPGYVGHEDGGQLSEQIRKKPYSVILFDELEKAHPDVFNILLQVLDDGRITDSKGKKIDFRNTVIMMTSNAGATSIVEPKQLGFAWKSDAEAEHNRMKQGVMEEVKRTFRPEFLNRIDETVVFHSLKEEEQLQITELLCKRLVDQCKAAKDILLHLSPETIAWLAKKGYDSKYGARPLKRSIATNLEDPLAEWILTGRIQPGDSVKLHVEDDRLIIASRRKRGKRG